MQIIGESAGALVGLDPADMQAVHGAIRSIDDTSNYSRMGGAAAFAVSIAAAESAALARGEPLFQTISDGCQSLRGGDASPEIYLPRPLGNILGGGAHAGAGAPDIQEILVCAVGARTAREAVETNIAVHAELGAVLQCDDPVFSGGKGDEGGWAPRADNEKALALAAKACENLGYTLGREVALGVDFAASTQWDEKAGRYDYARAGVSNTPGEQIEFASSIIDRYKLAYAEDAVHEDDFDGMAEVASRCPRTLVTGDDLTVTSAEALRTAVSRGSCNAAILKVNQAGGLRDAAEFAAEAGRVRRAPGHVAPLWRDARRPHRPRGDRHVVGHAQGRHSRRREGRKAQRARQGRGRVRPGGAGFNKGARGGASLVSQRQERDGGGYDPHREQQNRSIRAGTQVVTKSMSRFGHVAEQRGAVQL